MTVALVFLSLRACVLALCATFALACVSSPVRADETASLANVLLAEQLIDVATTQQLLHTASCKPPTPVVTANLVRIGTRTNCIVGSEADPLARPFVVSPLANTAAALAVNGLVRLAARGLGPRTSARFLKAGVAFYPTILLGNVSALHAERFGAAVSLSIRR